LLQSVRPYIRVVNHRGFTSSYNYILAYIEHDVNDLLGSNIAAGRFYPNFHRV